jgi:hypothetical protein
VPGIAFGGRKAARGLNASQFGDLAQRDLVDPGTRRAQCCRLRSKARATVGSSPSRNTWFVPRPAGRPTAALAADDGARRQNLMRKDGIAHLRVRAHTVSSVVDRGTAPAVGTRLAVFLKPTMPLRAAGIRIEPPVSEPRPMKAAPVATDTAAPDDEPPGTRGVSGLPTGRSCRPLAGACRNAD